MASKTPTQQRGRSEALNMNINSSIGLFAILLGLRLINALSIRTFFQPDEYFQALEPAWNLAFGGSSGAWVTWEWREGLRSATPPLLFASAYKVADYVSQLVQATPSVRADILIAAPKVLQAALAALTDVFTYRLACRVYGFGSQAALASLFLTVLSPWQWFASVRTFANSLETTLTIIALDLWPWDWFLRDAVNNSASKASVTEDSPHKAKDPSASDEMYPFLSALCAAAIACILRPTNILVWATLSIALVLRHGHLQKAITLLRNAIVVGISVIVLSAGVDANFYKMWVFPPYRFLHFNLVQNLAVFYGKNRWDYYFTEGLPLLLTTALPFGVIGMWQALRGVMKCSGNREGQIRFVLALAVVTSVIALSLVSHKEMRFIYPLLPILHILAAKPMAAFFDPLPIPAKKVRLAILMLAVATNVVIAGYTGYVHQRGVIDVMHYLRHEHEARIANNMGSGTLSHTTIGFLAPCHSTPWRSHLVYREIDAWALTCEPPLKLSPAEREHYMDEADIFYASPEKWLRDNVEDIKNIQIEQPVSQPALQAGEKSLRAWPEYLAFFQQLEPLIRRELEDSEYRECWRGFNTHWHDDMRRQGDVVVWCMRP